MVLCRTFSNYCRAFLLDSVALQKTFPGYLGRLGFYLDQKEFSLEGEKPACVALVKIAVQLEG